LTSYYKFLENNNSTLVKEKINFSLLSIPRPLLFISFFTLSLILLLSAILQFNNALSINNAPVKIENGIKNQEKKIAFVEPTFTYAAYRNGSFYNFYDKYSPEIQYNSNLTVTNDLNLLKNKPIPHQPFFYYINPTYTTIPYKGYFDLLLQHVKRNSSQVSTLTDVDVHQGKIFQPNGKNTYDILFLFHNEYVTQKEYDNLRQFVKNGGTIVFNQANVLFAEVNYNNNNDSISLVKGHFWKVDNNSAKNTIGERWLNENREWMGSNFLDVSSKNNVYFNNDPFNYKHVEEQYITNPNAKIFFNFDAYGLPDNYSNATIAMYEMHYGKGKVVNLAIWGPTLTNNTQFLNFYDQLILPIAFNQSNAINQTLLSTYSKIPSLGVKKCSIYDPESNLITVFCNATLSTIDHDVNNKTVLKKENNGIWTLNAIIKVNPNAQITIDKNDTSWLRITNQNVSEPNFIKISGSAKINGVKITSWNSSSNDVIKQDVNGTLARPFIVVDNATGPVDISNSEIAFLGFGKYPLNGFIYRHGGNGSSIYNNNFHDMWDGFYSDSVQSITIKNNTFYNNLRHGLNPDASSHDLTVFGNMAYNNSDIGMLCSDRCHNILFDNNTVFNNGNSGFELSSNTYNSTVKKNFAFNEKVGISIISSSNNKINDNIFKSNERGIFIGGNSSGNNIYNNTLIDDKIGIYFDNPLTTNNLLKNNNMDSKSTTPVFLNG